MLGDAMTIGSFLLGYPTWNANGIVSTKYGDGGSSLYHALSAEAKVQSFRPCIGRVAPPQSSLFAEDTCKTQFARIAIIEENNGTVW